jgi:hypothetical protein
MRTTPPTLNKDLRHSLQILSAVFLFHENQLFALM